MKRILYAICFAIGIMFACLANALSDKPPDDLKDEVRSLPISAAGICAVESLHIGEAPCLLYGDEEGGFAVVFSDDKSTVDFIVQFSTKTPPILRWSRLST